MPPTANTDNTAANARRLGFVIEMVRWDLTEWALYRLPLTELRARYARACAPPVPGQVHRNVEKRRHELRHILARRIEVLEAAREHVRRQLDDPAVLDTMLALLALLEGGSHTSARLAHEVRDTYLDRYFRAGENMPTPGEGVVPSFDPRAGGEIGAARDADDDTPASREMEALRRARGAM